MIIERRGMYLIRRDSFGRYRLMRISLKGTETQLGIFKRLEEATNELNNVMKILRR
jgi:hypothetical protein